MESDESADQGEGRSFDHDVPLEWLYFAEQETLSFIECAMLHAGVLPTADDVTEEDIESIGFVGQSAAAMIESGAQFAWKSGEDVRTWPGHFSLSIWTQCLPAPNWCQALEHTGRIARVDGKYIDPERPRGVCYRNTLESMRQAVESGLVDAAKAAGEILRANKDLRSTSGWLRVNTAAQIYLEVLSAVRPINSPSNIHSATQQVSRAAKSPENHFDSRGDGSQRRIEPKSFFEYVLRRKAELEEGEDDIH